MVYLIRLVDVICTYIVISTSYNYKQNILYTFEYLCLFLSSQFDVVYIIMIFIK